MTTEITFHLCEYHAELCRINAEMCGVDLPQYLAGILVNGVLADTQHMMTCHDHEGGTFVTDEQIYEPLEAEYGE